MTWYVSLRRSHEAAQAVGGLVGAEECVSKPQLLETGAIRCVLVVRNRQGEAFQHLDTVVAAGEWISFYEDTYVDR